MDEKRNVLYVGKAKDLKARVSSYFTNKQFLGEKTRVLVSQIKTIQITVVESELESLLLEAFYIQKFKPKYNIRLTDDKSYPLIRITKKDPYPAVFLDRRAEDPDSLYFGPFPSSGAVRMVLRTLRRIYPFLTSRNHQKRKCLYNHLGLCVCPPVHDSPELRKEYKQYIRNIIRILEGESRTLQKELERERDAASKKEEFEKAAVLQKRIHALQTITEPFRRPVEYDVNPNLREDIRQQELNELRRILQDNGLSIKHPERIECYDISNIQGTNATGSLVVLTNGEIDKSQYRKFKIRQDGKPNDFAMMREMLTRRLKHDDWETPELIIIDGGKGQVGIALEVLKEAGASIPVVGLAKREETIIIPIDQEGYAAAQRKTEAIHRLKLYGNNEERFVEAFIPKQSPAMHLIIRIRDEAHRFAISYHRKLRSKQLVGK